MSSVAPPRAMTVPEFRAARGRGTKLAVVTAYDYTSARLCDEAGVDCILVGDSLGMVVQGHPTSLPVTLDEMIYHTKCVVRGVRRALVVADLPFLTYQVSPRQAVRNAGRLLKEAGAHAVKLEGGVRMRATVQACIDAGIPVMGHVGLTPQAVHQLGGFKVQRDAPALLADAAAVEEAGAFSVVVESVPADVGTRITAAVGIPTIGIGAGAGCDGQVLVYHDLLGLYPDFKPKFAKRYADLGTAVKQAVEAYCTEVREGAFPTAEHSFR
ncbi:3-methyl-2-oxobutanoate hydroxymethyltransferase : 3-methyl-2-oxobutanoate hydroxymethyltransferase OS=Singulisphaera acidiphila (strain ATCC BAA-1392 / DSM 18658 / VKM B-2454 / MOB10) GN=panB PE=3 SV=1: Pantoate_transf [Gemmataceae bacterium]|nr:3-methyl-2-oxobutanoate hydroxymethyltransferase : 3-methyl-2-oxobutanoate hydroxymethyltransferase OS=Singulisphaera acidiphila (strain ATCC BAA-1392 / DSM 18658 / VKM B-2454 / MOB10) GN=panB PE=3 SV=1: Pantoate_transf [Gemmataceae bacterium]VTT98002.1 3-methyl-2-oxobutanoate hydroxymethyltransferase : 3-methyl-2-oxobutanoate hydroxymethyltransferase OS=Singulisphaera acidiphila (strain ATCC BAA-1392 / DSM 18658 / VKM B-2454 / MOB10) GN=panB PE=3 SV=1: Pantoate_transf [Gemmataceae bacterium]